MRSAGLLLLLAAVGCDDGGATDPPDVGEVTDMAPARTPDRGPTVDGAPPSGDGGRADLGPVDSGQPDGGQTDGGQTDTWEVLVLLDGEPAADILVMQGGTAGGVQTDAQGRATVVLDRSIAGVPVLLASHPQARIRGFTVWPEERPPALLELTTYGPDNPEYAFQDPGEPNRRNSTAQCAHCHRTLNDQWFASPHRTSATNPVVRAIFSGIAAEGPAPDVRTHLGNNGECADCHAPGMDGRIGGRDLGMAAGRALDFGVHCDVCHRVDRVDLDSQAPGVAGRLILHRPSDPGPISLGAGGVLPLTFGPSHDSPNPRMGNVQRDHFRDGRICAGCHEYSAAQAVDRQRWPDGRLPVHSTWSEWEAGALHEAVRCPDCHMPPLPGVMNGGDLQLFPDADIGISGGFVRPAGTTRGHRWEGPRARESGMLELAAALFVDWSIVNGEVLARVTLRNQGAGHALPTGEPLRAVLVTVEAACDDQALAPSGGDALPGWAGALESRAAGADWTRWPGAEVGQVLRVIRRGGFHDYDGIGPFGDGRFDAEAKGLPVETVVGAATINAVAPDGSVVLDRPLPAGDQVYRTAGQTVAGSPGFAFARVLVDAEGQPMVPHFLAVDVRSDNRLLPMARWTSTHRFRTVCPEPEVVARAIYRPLPATLARARGFDVEDYVMTEARR